MKRKRRRVLRIKARAIIAIMIFAATYFIWTNVLREDGAETREGLSTVWASDTSPTALDQTLRPQELNNQSEATHPEPLVESRIPEGLSTSAATGITMVPMYVADIVDTQYLKLVNRELYMRNPANRRQLVSAWPTVPVRATDIYIHESALKAVRALFDSSNSVDGLGTLFVTSGYRSYATQQHLYATTTNRDYVLPPGHSEHQTGLGVDILIMGVGMGEMSGTTEATWMAENAWRYGLILRYPAGRQYITGVAYEPWHFRYTGRIHSWLITENNWVLEEYIQFLKENNYFSTELLGRTYHIWRQQPNNGVIYVPANMQFTISSDNKGGYVVTGWE